MNDDRIREIERRLMRADEALRETQRKAAAAIDTANMLFVGGSGNSAIPGGGGGGGGSGVTLFRWASRFCFKVVFDTEPTLNAGASLNTTQDGLSLAAAIEALETPLEAFPYIEQKNSDGEVQNIIATSDNSQYKQSGGPSWSFFRTSGEYSIDTTHIRSVGWAFQCGAFPYGGGILTVYIDDTGDPPPWATETANVEGKYVPCVFRNAVADEHDVVEPCLTPFDQFFTIDGKGNWFYGFPMGDNVLAKWVDFAFYRADGSRAGYRRLTYFRQVYEPSSPPVEPWEPYAFDDGPAYGTTGFYQFTASGVQRTIQGGSSSGFLSSLGVADVYVAWGEESNCSDVLPPVNEPIEDWEDFCAAVTAASATFNKIPGLTIKFNGTTITDEVLGTYVDPPTITFEFSDRLVDYLEANPDVYIMHQWTRICGGGGSTHPQSGAGVVVNGGELVIDRNTVCGGTETTEVLLDIKMEASPVRNLFDDICCTPYATHCSVTSLETDQITFEIDPS